MKLKEVVEKLKAFEERFPESECIIAINKACGFPQHDHIEMYPIEAIYERKQNDERDYPLCGYCNNPDEESKILFYVYP